MAFIEGVLRRTLHNGFPVVEATSPGGDREDGANGPARRYSLIQPLK